MQQTTDLIHPFINLNGTHPDVLAQSIMDVREHVSGAIKALRMCHPNGRDYPPYHAAGPDALSLATDQHRRRVDQLETLYQELETMAVAILDQQNERPSS